MSKSNVIHIIVNKRNSRINKNKKMYFNKLSKNGITHLFHLFTEDEQLKLFTLNNKFKSAYFDINSIDEKDSLNNFKYMAELNKLKKESKGFSPYLNVLLNLNIINLNPEYLGAKVNEENKYNRLKKFLEKNYEETNLNKILIQINEKDDLKVYYSVLNLLNPEMRQKLKYDIDISSSIDINENKDMILNLFNLISFRNIKPFNDKKKNKLVEIQNYYIENNIKTYHKYIWSQRQSSIDNAKKYFSTNNNCLIGINNKQSIPLCENNKDSINTINMPNYAISEFNYPEIKLKKIKFSFPSEEFNSILLNNNNLDTLEEISGLIITRNNINEFIKKINGMKKLKKIYRIKFGGVEEEEESDDIQNKLFQDFFNGIKNRHSENLVEISTWFYVFKKGKDYEYILNNFPNIRKIQEDYDASGLYDQRIDINNVFNCNAERPFNENDLIAITKIVKNYINQKKEGNNTIQFELTNNFERMNQLLEFWNKNNEKIIIERINYINFIFEAELKGNESVKLNKINCINFTNENNCLISLLKDVKIVNHVIIKDSNLLEKNMEFFTNKDILVVAWNKEELTDGEFENLLKIKSVKYIILDDKIIQEKANLLKGSHNFKIIPKMNYIDISSTSQ